jgi:hypothetical protein
MTTEQSALISALNDQLRQAQTGGVINVTAGVAALGPMFVARSLKAIAQISDFDEGDDPYGEHDFGAIEVDGEKVFWKIDYYDAALTYAAEDPADPARCRRVLTVMLAQEY